MNKTVSQLSSRLLALMARGVGVPTSDAEFNQLALDLFAFQFENNAPYRAFCELKKRTPDRVAHWREIPAVPARAFKEMTLTSFPPSEAVAEFHTSGTTQANSGRHLFQTFDIYEAAIRPNFTAHLLPDGARLPMLALTLAPEEAPHSSLSHMMGLVVDEFGEADSRFFVANGTLRCEELARDLCEAQWSQQPVCLLGTAFAFVQFFDYLAERNLRFDLPAGSRAMETGGFKGRSRELTKPVLYALFEQRLALPAWRVVNEYGMTELSSQFYDSSLREKQRTDRKTPPPWVRVQIVNPHTNEEAAPGDRGLILIFDAANLGSVMCIQTEDLGMRDGDGFVVMGRATGAEARGCSLNAEGLALA